MAELKPCPFCGGEADCNNAGFMQYGWKKWAVECPIRGVVTHFFDTEEKATAAWNMRAMRCEWISAEDRLPEDDVQVLACTKHGKAFSAHCEKGKWRVSGSVKITHWMPLPEPPKEGRQ